MICILHWCKLVKAHVEQNMMPGRCAAAMHPTSACARAAIVSQTTPLQVLHVLHQAQKVFAPFLQDQQLINIMSHTFRSHAQ